VLDVDVHNRPEGNGNGGPTGSISPEGTKESKSRRRNGGMAGQ